MDGAALNDGGRLTDLQFDGAAFRLRDRMLIEDEADAIGRPEGAEERSWFERLAPGLRIRKELIIDDCRVHEAQLLWCGVEPEGNDVPLHLSLNGTRWMRPPTKTAHPQCKHYYTADWAPSHFDNWFVVDVPAGALQDGLNTVEMWVEEAGPDEDAWEVMVAADSERVRGAEPARPAVGRSARSGDDGASWTSSGLGQRDEIDGEYCLRLSLQQHAPEGRFLSEPIDLADTDGISGPSAGSCTAHWDVDGDVSLRVRFGASPRPDDDVWSAWESVDGDSAQWDTPSGRWLQFEATLRTDDPRRSPSLRGVRLATDAGEQHSTTARLVELTQGRVTRSSMPFVWEDPEALADLRQRFELDQVVDGAATEFERMVRLMKWSYRIPLGQLNPYAWRFDDLPQLQRDANGAIELLGPYDEPRRQGHCLYCNLTLIAALLSFGYPARWVNMSTKHTYGHEVTEVWSNDYDKWVFLDATRDYYMTDPDTGVPLSLAEIGSRVAEGLTQPVTWDQPIPHQIPGGVSPDNVHVRYRQPDHGMPVYDGEHDMIMIGHLQMPLRNDFASRPTPVPWRISSNWGGSEFYCWSSEMFPPKLEYQKHTDRTQDWEPPLNRTALFLTLTADDAVLRVDADTVTPWADGFEVSFDGGPWERRAEAQWDWPLHEGLNRMMVRSRNRMGVTGPPSTAAVTKS